MKRLSPTALSILRALRTNPELSEVSNSTLAATAGRSLRMVGRALDELEQNELIRLSYRRSTGPGDVARTIELKGDAK